MKHKSLILIFSLLLLTSCSHSGLLASQQQIIINNGGASSSPSILYFTCGENAALDPGSEWSCGGNGETNQNFYLWDNVTITGLALDCNTGTGTAVVALQVGEVNSACQITSTTVNDATTCDVDIAAGSWVRPYTVSDSGHSACVITMRFITR